MTNKQSLSLAILGLCPFLLSATPSTSSTLDLGKVFEGAPVIYTLLIAMSILASVIWLYSLLTVQLEKLMPKEFTQNVRTLFAQNKYELALETCKKNHSFSSKILASAIEARPHGPQVVLEAIHSEGRRMANNLWQRISILNDIAVVAPMFGLLGTVIGMFFAFYDTQQSSESLASIFDGLGIAVGTTVAGLIVAILAMVFYTTLKYRVVRLLNMIEDETVALANLIHEKPNA